MNIDDVVNRCSSRGTISRDSYNQTILANIPYMMDSEYNDICTDLEVLYNTVYSNDSSYGSSDKYTVPPFLDDISGKSKRKRHEHYDLYYRNNSDEHRHDHDNFNMSLKYNPIRRYNSRVKSQSYPNSTYLADDLVTHITILVIFYVMIVITIFFLIYRSGNWVLE